MGWRDERSGVATTAVDFTASGEEVMSKSCTVTGANRLGDNGQPEPEVTSCDFASH